MIVVAERSFSNNACAGTGSDTRRTPHPGVAPAPSGRASRENDGHLRRKTGGILASEGATGAETQRRQVSNAIDPTRKPSRTLAFTEILRPECKYFGIRKLRMLGSSPSLDGVRAEASRTWPDASADPSGTLPATACGICQARTGWGLSPDSKREYGPGAQPRDDVGGPREWKHWIFPRPRRRSIGSSACANSWPPRSIRRSTP